MKHAMMNPPIKRRTSKAMITPTRPPTIAPGKEDWFSGDGVSPVVVCSVMSEDVDGGVGVDCLSFSVVAVMGVVVMGEVDEATSVVKSASICICIIEKIVCAFSYLM